MYQGYNACLHCVYGAVVGDLLAVVGVLYLVRIKVVIRDILNTNHFAVQARACRLLKEALVIIGVGSRVVAALAALLAD